MTPTVAKITKMEFEVTLHDDEETHRKMEFLSGLETALDHSKKEVPESFLKLTDEIPFGARIRISVETLPGEPPEYNHSQANI